MNKYVRRVLEFVIVVVVALSYYFYDDIIYSR